MNRRSAIVLLALWSLCFGGRVVGTDFINFETAPVHPIDLSPDRSRLLVCNLPDARLAVLDVAGDAPLYDGEIPVGLDPVSVRHRTATEAWVVNHISDSISVVDVPSRRVIATIATLDTPCDVVFAGVPQRAFVSCAMPNVIQVFDPVSRLLVTNLAVQADRPKALATSADGRRVYAAIFESGNNTTVIGARLRNFLFIDNAVSRGDGPYGGVNPPPNSGGGFAPPPNPVLPSNPPPPATSLVVRRDAAGRWIDGNARDWTEFVSGTNAALTQRVPGWHLPDRDLAIVDTSDLSVTYATGLMNINMALAPHPVTGRIAVIGTDARNEIRFEPNLNGVFAQVKLAMVDPLALTRSVRDLNPHLDYLTPTIPEPLREHSIGDPRAIVWADDGTEGYVAGMGSRNVIRIDASGARLPAAPIEVGEGPCGLAFDSARARLHVFNRFANSVSVVDTAAGVVRHSVRLHDPTPVDVSAGRRHLYDTRRTSGAGHVACASCHVDARMDRLGWDLGSPAGELADTVVNHVGSLVTNSFHPMKGVMVTQTLQDIIGREPFHWRGDRADIEAFNGTFTNLQGAPLVLTPAGMREFRSFLASVRFPPNPFRALDNSLATNLALTGQSAIGEDMLPAGAPLPAGNALRGLDVFKQAESFCVTCHTLPTGLGLEVAMQDGVLKPVPPGPNGGRRFPHAFRLENNLRSKISQFRNMAEKIGMDGLRTESRAGFGFGHDGSVDSLPRFLAGLRIVPDQDVADLTAFLISVAGSDTGTTGATADNTPPSGTGRQLTIANGVRPLQLDAMIGLAGATNSRLDLVARGEMAGAARGWVFDPVQGVFQSDRRAQIHSAAELIATTAGGTAMTFMLVPRGLGRRLGVDRDRDGVFDRDELDAGGEPASLPAPVRVVATAEVVPAGGLLVLDAVIGGLAAPIVRTEWFKDGQRIPGATNQSFTIAAAAYGDAGDYAVRVETGFESWTSLPLRVSVVPLLVSVTPGSLQVRRSSNAVFLAATQGIGPFDFQWRRDGGLLTGVVSTNANLALTNVQLDAGGFYDVIVANAFGTVTSAPVALTILVNPTTVLPPLNQSVPVGGDATFSFVIAGNPPPYHYALRRSSTVLTNYAADSTTGFFTLRSVQLSNAGTYRVVVTNAANPSPGLTMPPVTLTVLADTDADGAPDGWETANGFDANSPADAVLDADGDGLSNVGEYLTGTNPRDARNVLRIERIAGVGDGLAALIQFQAASNTTYTVESRELTGEQPWLRLADVPAFATAREVTVTNHTSPGTLRMYRLVSPRRP